MELETKLKAEVTLEVIAHLEGSNINYMFDLCGTGLISDIHEGQISILELLNEAIGDFYYAPKKDIEALKQIQSKISEYIKLIEEMPEGGY